VEVIIRSDRDEAAVLVARIVAHELRARPTMVLGLATGRTMEPVYAYLVALHRNEGLDFSRCSTFNLDEYIGIPASNPGSYRHTMDQLLFDQVNIRKENTHLPNGMAADLGEECRRYEAAIVEAGGIDLQLLGIGNDGHIGFNEPYSSLRSRTRAKALTPETMLQNACLFRGDASAVPRRALTMGVGTILDSRRCLLLATGAAKAPIVARAVEGPLTAMVTASALQLHPQCQVVVDQEAASLLSDAGYHGWVFENEPEWEPFRQQPSKGTPS
jgi:glucosamine-6-phosphate deaminase